MSTNPALLIRETRGDIVSGKRFIVSDRVVDDLKARALYNFPEGTPDVLYSAIDPSGGGSGSDYAIVTLALSDNKPVIVGITRSSSADPVVIEEMIDSHYITIRRHPRYSQCLVRVFIEANLSFIDAGRIANQLHDPRYGNIDIFKEDTSPAKRYGIWTTTAKKEAYAEELARNAPLLAFATFFISDDADGCKAELLKQMGGFRREVVEAASGAGGQASTALFNKVVFTGKGGGKKDDLALALQIALYYMYRSVFRDDAFLYECTKSGIRAST